MSDASLTVPPDVVEIIGRCRMEGPLLYLPEQLDRDVYKRVNVILELAGGTWERKAKAHRFDIDAEEALDGVCLFGEVTRAASDQFFPTPEPLAIRMANMADIRPGMVVLEPSAGEGAIATECLGPRTHPNGAVLHAVELFPRTYDKLVSRLKSEGRQHWAAVIGDFLEYEPRPVYDRVVMNPPFAKQQDIRHILHAWEFLKPGGILVAICSRGVRFRSTRPYLEFRAWLERFNATIEDLPEKTFAESGTQVNACLIKARKPKPPTPPKEQEEA